MVSMLFPTGEVWGARDLGVFQDTMLPLLVNTYIAISISARFHKESVMRILEVTNCSFIRK